MSARESAMRSSIRTARQTTCPGTVQRSTPHSTVNMCFPETLLKRIKSIWRTVPLTEQQTLRCCDRFMLSVWRSVLHMGRKYFVSILWAQNSPTRKLFGLWTWSISQVLNAAYPRAYKNTGFISPLQSIYNACLCDLSIHLAPKQQTVKVNNLKQWTFKSLSHIIAAAGATSSSSLQ